MKKKKALARDGSISLALCSQLEHPLNSVRIQKHAKGFQGASKLPPKICIAHPRQRDYSIAVIIKVIVMRCLECQDLFTDYWDGSLKEQGKLLEQFELHLKSCGLCRMEWKEFQQTIEWLRTVEAVQPPATLRSRVLARLSSPPVPVHPTLPTPSLRLLPHLNGLWQRLTPVARWVALPAAGALLAGVLVLAVTQFQHVREVSVAPLPRIAHAPTPQGESAMPITPGVASRMAAEAGGAGIETPATAAEEKEAAQPAQAPMTPADLGSTAAPGAPGTPSALSRPDISSVLRAPASPPTIGTSTPPSSIGWEGSRKAARRRSPLAGLPITTFPKSKPVSPSESEPTATPTGEIDELKVAKETSAEQPPAASRIVTPEIASQATPKEPRIASAMAPAEVKPEIAAPVLSTPQARSTAETEKKVAPVPTPPEPESGGLGDFRGRQGPEAPARPEELPLGREQRANVSAVAEGLGAPGRAESTFDMHVQRKAEAVRAMRRKDMAATPPSDSDIDLEVKQASQVVVGQQAVLEVAVLAQRSLDSAELVMQLPLGMQVFNVSESKPAEGEVQVWKGSLSPRSIARFPLPVQAQRPGTQVVTLLLRSSGAELARWRLFLPIAAQATLPAPVSPMARRFHVDWQNWSLSDAFLYLANQMGQPIMTPPNLEQTVSLRLGNATYKQVLDELSRRYSLRYRQVGGTTVIEWVGGKK